VVFLIIRSDCVPNHGSPFDIFLAGFTHRIVAIGGVSTVVKEIISLEERA
jgi:hypothetical protein